MVSYLCFKFSIKYTDTQISAFSHYWHIIKDINQEKISKLVTFHQWKSLLYITILRPWNSQPPSTLSVDVHSPKQMSLVVAEINGLHNQQIDTILDQAVRGIKSWTQRALRETVLLATLFLTHQWPSRTDISADLSCLRTDTKDDQPLKFKGLSHIGLCLQTQ